MPVLWIILAVLALVGGGTAVAVLASKKKTPDGAGEIKAAPVKAFATAIWKPKGANPKNWDMIDYIDITAGIRYTYEACQAWTLDYRRELQALGHEWGYDLAKARFASVYVARLISMMMSSGIPVARVKAWTVRLRASGRLSWDEIATRYNQCVFNGQRDRGLPFTIDSDGYMVFVMSGSGPSWCSPLWDIAQWVLVAIIGYFCGGGVANSLDDSIDAFIDQGQDLFTAIQNAISAGASSDELLTIVDNVAGEGFAEDLKERINQAADDAGLDLEL